MTPKEKAQELVDKYYWTFGDGYLGDQHIQCALIAVDEIIVQIYSIDHQYRAIYNEQTGYYSYLDSKELIFWKEVKQEIEKL